MKTVNDLSAIELIKMAESASPNRGCKVSVRRGRPDLKREELVIVWDFAHSNRYKRETFCYHVSVPVSTVIENEIVCGFNLNEPVKFHHESMGEILIQARFDMEEITREFDLKCVADDSKNWLA